MRCQRCGKAISPLRQLTDREFCSDEHRKRGGRASASALRDLEYDDDQFWRSYKGRAAAKSNLKTGGASFGVVAVFAVSLLLLVRHWFPETAAPSPTEQATAEEIMRTSPIRSNAAARRDDLAAAPGLLAKLGDALTGRKDREERDDFRNGVKDWVAAGGAERKAGGWLVRDGKLRPGQMRIWRPTIEAQDYRVQFLGQIEKKAVAWSFRASDANNYYASKIILRKPGEVAGASLVRWAVVDSRADEPVELPLPVTLQRDKPYEIAFTATGNAFRTSIDGHLVDEWKDSRLKSGGVGFFADEGETALIHWVRFREGRERGGFFAALLFLPPWLEAPASVGGR